MSVHLIRRQVYEVRYREAGRHRAKRVYGSRKDAEAFDRKVKNLKSVGDLGLLEHGKKTVEDLSVEWWERYALPNLSPKTRANHEYTLDAHILPNLGSRQIGSLRAGDVEDMTKAMNTGPVATGKAVKLLSQMLKWAQQREWIARNPAEHVKKPSQKRQRTVTPLTPEQVEGIRRMLDGRVHVPGATVPRGQRGTGAGVAAHTSSERGSARNADERRDLQARPRLVASGLLDSTLVSLLAYAGLRPGEALDLRWKDIGENTILIQASKTGQTRTVRLLPSLATDLNEWRLASGRPPADALVFPNRKGERWTDNAYKLWSQRNFTTAAKAAGVPTTRPYDCRHGFASLLLYAGLNIVEVAAQLGHSPALSLRTYQHLLAGIEERPHGEPWTWIEGQIRKARQGQKESAVG